MNFFFGQFKVGNVAGHHHRMGHNIILAGVGIVSHIKTSPANGRDFKPTLIVYLFAGQAFIQTGFYLGQVSILAPHLSHRFTHNLDSGLMVRLAISFINGHINMFPIN